MKTEDNALLQEAIDLLHKSGSVEYATKKARSMMEEAWGKLEKTMEESEGKRYLEELSGFLIDREL
jgi:geranylgeranyl pyrophosphate synthase